MTVDSLKIVILTDGKIGDLAQCRGIALALAGPDNIEEIVVQPNWLTSLPLPSMPLSAVDRQSSLFASDAQVFVASGRRTVPYLRAVKRLRGRDCFTVYLKDPKFNHESIDFIWAPEHDRLNAPNSFSTLTSPHALSPQVLAEARQAATLRFAKYSSANVGPNVGLILGGASKSVVWEKSSRDRLVCALLSLPPETNVLITASRRTPKELVEAVCSALADHAINLWDGEGPNPYIEMLSWCDRLIVTGDSHNMVSETLASGHPVHVFRPSGLPEKLRYFLDTLESEGWVTDVSQGFEREGGGTPLDATPLIASEIRKRFDANQSRF